MSRDIVAAGSLLTIQEWADLDEDAEGELVNGQLEEEEVPTVLHEAIVAWLMWTLSSWCSASRTGIRLRTRVSSGAAARP